MESRVGFEPTNNRVAACRVKPDFTIHSFYLVGMAGIEPTYQRYQHCVLTIIRHSHFICSLSQAFTGLRGASSLRAVSISLSCTLYTYPITLLSEIKLLWSRRGESNSHLRLGKATF